MKRVYVVCLFLLLTTAFLLSQSNPVPLINPSAKVAPAVRDFTRIRKAKLDGTVESRPSAKCAEGRAPDSFDGAYTRPLR